MAKNFEVASKDAVVIIRGYRICTNDPGSDAVLIGNASSAFKVSNSLYIGDKTYNGSEDVTITAADLGLSSAFKYHGMTTTPLTDGSTTRPITIDGVSHSQSAGCVVIYTSEASGNTEFLWNGSKWEKLGDGINYKVKQNAKSDPSANGSGTTFISTISQDSNGVITATKKYLDLSGYSVNGHTHDQYQEKISGLSTIIENATSGAKAYGWGNHAKAGYTKNIGTITEVKMNGESKGISGVVDLGTVLTSTAITVDSAITSVSATTAEKSDNVKAFNAGGKRIYLVGHSNDSTPEYDRLYKNSSVYMENGNLYASSDKTLKTHLMDIDIDLDAIKMIPKVLYHWNDDKDKHPQIGTYAQDIEKVCPEIVTTSEDGIMGVAYDRIGIIALSGIDKLYEMVQDLKTKNLELETRIKELENK